MSFVLDALGIRRPRYLDLGAHHPYYLSNTYLFYRRGACGVNVEADPRLALRLRRARPRDVTLNIGVGPEPGVLDFYVLSVPTLSTFSKEEAKRYIDQFGYRIERTVAVPVQTFTQLVESNFDAVPEFCVPGRRRSRSSHPAIHRPGPPSPAGVLRRDPVLLRVGPRPANRGDRRTDEGCQLSALCRHSYQYGLRG